MGLGGVGVEMGALGDEHAICARCRQGLRPARYPLTTHEQRLDGTTQRPGEPRRLGQELGRHRTRPPRSQLCDHEQGRSLPGLARGQRRRLGERRERSELPQPFSEPTGKLRRIVAFEQLPTPLDLDGFQLGDPRRGALGPDLVCTQVEIRQSEGCDGLLGCRQTLGLRREPLLGQIFRGRHERREWPAHGLEPRVDGPFRLEDPRRRIHAQRAHHRGLGPTQQLGDLGTHLARLGIDTRAADQHEIRPLPTNRRRQRSRRGERIRPGERTVAQVHRTVRTERQGVAQGFGCLRRSHGERDDLAAMRVAQRQRAQQRSQVEGTRLSTHAIADQPARCGVEAQRRQKGNVLETDHDAHALHLALPVARPHRTAPDRDEDRHWSHDGPDDVLQAGPPRHAPRRDRVGRAHLLGLPGRRGADGAG